MALVWLLGLAIWTAFVAWLAPSGAWDGLWYHEPMVGFALQNRGFSIVTVPPSLEMINGYPRATENLQLWASALYDRRLVDVVPSFAFLVAALGVFTLARRHGASTSASLGVAVVALTIPAAVLQLRSTYIDLAVLAALLVAIHFVTRPTLRARDVWMAGLALGLLGTIKSNGLVFGGVLGAWLAVRVLLALDRRLLASLLGATLVASLYALPTYIRNLVLHDNPFWPLTYESSLLGVRFQGTVEAGQMQRGFDYVWTELTGPPTFGEDYHDTARHSYGYALPFVAAPLLLFAAPSLVRAWLDRSADRRARSAAGLLVGILGFGLLVQVASPGHHWARFSLAFPALALVVIARWVSLEGRRRVEDAALGAMLVLNAVTLLWAKPAWDVTVREALELAAQPLAERNLADTSRCLLPSETRRLRDEAIGPGDLVVVGYDVAFSGNVWNDAFSNRVMYVEFTGRDAFLARLDELGAKWAYVHARGSEATALQGSPAWARVGPGSFEDEIYERVVAGGEAPAAP